MLDCISVVAPQDNLEVRIDELETVNQKLQRRRCDTVSTFSSLSLSRCSSFRLVRSTVIRQRDRMDVFVCTSILSSVGYPRSFLFSFPTIFRRYFEIFVRYHSSHFTAVNDLVLLVKRIVIVFLCFTEHQ